MPDDSHIPMTSQPFGHPPGLPSEPGTPKPGKSSAQKWLGWILALGALASCLLFVDLNDLLANVRRLQAREIAVVLVLLTFDRVLMALKWRLLLTIGGAHLGPFSVIRIYYQGWLVGAFLPSHLGGDILRAHLVAQRTGVVHPAFASLVMEKVIGLISAVNWAIVGGVILGCWLEPGRQPLWVGLGALAALVFNGLFVVSLRDVVHDFALGTLAHYHQSRLIGLLHRFYAAYADFSRFPRTLLLNLLLTALEHGLQLLILFKIASSLGIDVGRVVFFAAAAAQTLIVRIPITPDGWGTGELAAIAVFGLVGISAAAAFSTTMIYRFLGIVAALPGFAFLVLPRELLRWTAGAQPVQRLDHPAMLAWRAPMYLGGCLCFSLGVKLFINADLGVDPFHAMTIGLVETVGLPYLQIGFMDGMVTFALLIVWMVWNRKLPPLMIFFTMVLIGGLVDFWNSLPLEPVIERMGSRALTMLAGLVLTAYGSALIIMSGIGIRVVDLVALTMVNRLGCRFYLAKLALEAGFLVIGLMLGGPVGIAAFAFVCVVGPFVEPLIWANRRFLKLPDYGLGRAMSHSSARS